MTGEPQLLLIASVAAVGVLHTMVPDHWAPLVAIGRQRGWSRAETLRAALVAGAGHVASTLLIGILVWLAGAAAARHFGRLVDSLSSLALVGFGGWIMISAWRELRRSPTHAHAHDHRHDGGHRHGHDHETRHGHETLGYGFAGDPLYLPLPAGTAVPLRHRHRHRHGGGPPHLHWHDHTAATAHPATPAADLDPPLHEHRHKTNARTALLLILGSSPMVEGIPAFFAASRYGGGLIAAMALVFAAATIGTYALFCVGSAAGAARLRLGALERYGEVLSGGFIALVGIVFGVWGV